MTIRELLSAAAYRMQAETGTSGFSDIVLTDEAYDKLVLELGCKIKHYGNPAQGRLRLYLADRYVKVSREHEYEDSIG